MKIGDIVEIKLDNENGHKNINFPDICVGVIVRFPAQQSWAAASINWVAGGPTYYHSDGDYHYNCTKEEIINVLGEIEQ